MRGTHKHNNHQGWEVRICRGGERDKDIDLRAPTRWHLHQWYCNDKDKGGGHHANDNGSGGGSNSSSSDSGGSCGRGGGVKTFAMTAVMAMMWLMRGVHSVLWSEDGIHS